MNFKEQYIKETDKVSFSSSFNTETVEIMISAKKRKEDAIIKKAKIVKVAFIAAIIAALISMSAVAVNMLLSAGEVADRVGQYKLASLFQNSDFQVQTVENEKYRVSFLGLVSAENFNGIEELSVENEKSYAVYSISTVDGTPLSLIDGAPVQIAPVVDSYSPLMIWTLGMSASGMEENGVLYYLFDYCNLEFFADNNVYLAVFEGAFPTKDILTQDKQGNVVYSENYNGFKGMFRLDLDKNKANPEAVKNLLGNY